MAELQVPDLIMEIDDDHCEPLELDDTCCPRDLFFEVLDHPMALSEVSSQQVLAMVLERIGYDDFDDHFLLAHGSSLSKQMFLEIVFSLAQHPFVTTEIISTEWRESMNLDVVDEICIFRHLDEECITQNVEDESFRTLRPDIKWLINLYLLKRFGVDYLTRRHLEIADNQGLNTEVSGHRVSEYTCLFQEFYQRIMVVILSKDDFDILEWFRDLDLLVDVRSEPGSQLNELSLLRGLLIESSGGEELRRLINGISSELLTEIDRLIIKKILRLYEMVSLEDVGVNYVPFLKREIPRLRGILSSMD